MIIANLESLNLSRNNIRVIKGLDALSNLKWLNVSRNSILRIDGLENLGKNLESIDFSNNCIEEISNLHHCTTIHDLGFNDNRIKKISNLDNLQHLKTLGLGNNQIRKIEGLEHLTDLKLITLFGNKITQIEGMGSLKSVELIHIDANAVQRTLGLENCSALKELYLNHNHVRHLEGLDHLEHLWMLEISHNQLESLEGIPPNLNKLNAANNKMTSILPLKGTPYNSVFDLSCNRIARVEPGTITQVELLDLSRNLLGDMDFVRDLTYCGGLNLSHNRISRLVLPARSRAEICMEFQNPEYPFYVAGNPLPASDLERLSRYLEGFPPAPGDDNLIGFIWDTRKKEAN